MFPLKYIDVVDISKSQYIDTDIDVPPNTTVCTHQHVFGVAPLSSDAEPT